MTLLAAWMKKHRRDDAWLAEQLGVHRSQANRIKRGVSALSLDKAAKLQAITKIPAAKFADGPMRAQPEGAAA